MSEQMGASVRQIVDVSPAPAFVVNDRYEILYCNNEFARVVDAARSDDIIGEGALSFLPDGDRENAQNRLDQAIRDGYAAGERELELQTIGESEKRVIGSIASLEDEKAFVTLENVREIDEEQIAIEKRKDQVEQLHDAALRISEAESEANVYDEIIRAVENITEMDYCLIGKIKDGMVEHAKSTDNFPEEGYEEVALTEENKSEYGAVKAILNQESHLVHDVEKSQDFKKIEFDSAIAVPIGKKGLITVTSYQKYTFTEEDLRLIEILSSRAEAGLDRIEREREMESQREKVERLHSVGVELTEKSSADAMLELMIEAAEEILDLNHCSVARVEGGHFRTVAKSATLSSANVHEPRVDSEEAGIAGKAYRRGESLLIEDAQEHPDANPQGEIGSVLTVPLGEFGLFQASAKEVIGIDETDRQLVELLSDHVEKALGQREQREELRQQRNEIELLQQVFSRIFRHNVKNELQVIKGNGQMIQSTAETESVSHGADILLEATERLIDATEKAREIENVVQERREVQTGSLRRMVSTAVADYKQEYPESEIIDDVDDVDVSAVIGLEEAIQNAVENALEHNDEPVAVELSSTVSQETVTLRIKDDGNGIPEDELEVLSQEGETALKHGSGVGLWLIKWAVEKSDGELSIGTVENGTRVEMILPQG